MAVLDPLKVSITNFPHDQSISIEIANIPGGVDHGKHTVPFDRIIYIDKADFQEVSRLL
jgi:glutaminyl-tRNA synthetase